MAQGAVASEHGALGAHSHNGQTHTHDQSKRLGAFLCWAVVFADIGTSVYYVPGILYGQFHSLAGLFVSLTMGAFVLLALKYAEVSVRFPEGGGVVTVSGRALNPWAGALGGMFILVDYFLTAAISSLSGLQYFQSVIPAISPYVLPGTIAVLLLLGILNWWGIRESAVVSAVIAVAAFVSDIVILVVVLISVPMPTILSLLGDMFTGKLTFVTALTGFAGAFLAFSGLESISQLSPVMRIPRRKTVSLALGLVIITVGLTSPFLTIFATTLLNGQNTALLTHPIPPSAIDPNQFISQLGGAFGGPILAIATAITASALLIFASNTAIIGTYHVFMALSHMSFFPKAVLVRDPRRDTPIVSIALATIIPILILIAVNGQIDLLGQLYAFGLLGAFALTCVSLDVLRFRERRGGRQIAFHDEDEYAAKLLEPPEEEVEDIELGPSNAAEAAWQAIQRAWVRAWPQINFGLGLLTTVLVVTAWTTNLIVKRDATIFGGGLTIAGMAIAIWHYRHEERSGRNTIMPSWVTTYAPDTVLAIITAGTKHNREIVESALHWARGRKTLIYFLTEHPHVQPERWQIELRAARDPDAQATFRMAFEMAQRLGTPIQVFYSAGDIRTAVTAWRVTQSRDVVADPEVARKFGAIVNPSFISYRRQDGVQVAHYVFLPETAPLPAPALRAPATPAAPSASDFGATEEEEASAVDEALTLEDFYQWARESDAMAGTPGGGSPNGHAEPPSDAGDQSAPRHPVKFAEPKPPAAAREASQQEREQPTVEPGAPPPIESDMEDDYSEYYWNGVDFVRRGEEEAPPQE
ncbi:MAG TPA: amino acid permease [Ktedonobacterales bacterium]|nr:amino acid permease [Ktedonobacterales bacterium]